MLRSLFLLLEGLLGSSLARILTGAGLSLVSFAGLTVAVTTALNVAMSYINGIPGDVLQFACLMGLGPALSIIGAALLTRAGMSAATLGIKKAAGH